MQELIVKNNPSGLKVFINGVPQIECVTSAQIDVVVVALEKQVDKHFGQTKTE